MPIPRMAPGRCCPTLLRRQKPRAETFPKQLVFARGGIHTRCACADKTADRAAPTARHFDSSTYQIRGRHSNRALRATACHRDRAHERSAATGMLCPRVQLTRAPARRKTRPASDQIIDLLPNVGTKQRLCCQNDNLQASRTGNGPSPFRRARPRPRMPMDERAWWTSDMRRTQNRRCFHRLPNPPAPNHRWRLRRNAP